MNRTIAQAVTSAVTFAGVAGLWLLWIGVRRHHRQASKRELRLQLKRWEGEGGNLSPSAAVAPRDAG